MISHVASDPSALTTSAETSTPTEALPSRRVAFTKQLDILRAYGALGATGQPVAIQQVADVVGLSTHTVSLPNAFFQAAGLVLRVESGAMKPAAEVVEFHRAYQW